MASSLKHSLLCVFPLVCAALLLLTPVSETFALGFCYLGSLAEENSPSSYISSTLCVNACMHIHACVRSYILTNNALQRNTEALEVVNRMKQLPKYTQLESR